MGNPPFEDVSPIKKLGFFQPAMLVYPKELLIEFPKIPTAPCPALSLEAENPICLNLETAGSLVFVDDEKRLSRNGDPQRQRRCFWRNLWGGFEPKT